MKPDIRPFTLLTQILAANGGEHLHSVLKHNQQAINWENLITLANAFLMSPALWCDINAKHLLPYVPDQIADYLFELYKLNKVRNQSLRKQAIEAARQLNTAGITPILLKGAVSLFNEQRDIGERIMTDLDVLIEADKLDSAIAGLRRLGYQARPEDVTHYDSHHHYAPMFRFGDYASIELHHGLLLNEVSHYLPDNSAFENAPVIKVEDIRFRVLSPEHAVLHNFIHSEIVDRCHSSGTVNLRSLYDLGWQVKGRTIDWGALESVMSAHGRKPELTSYLGHAERLLNLPVSAHARSGLRNRLHGLRCRMRIENSVYRLIDDKLQRFSAYHVSRRYHCGASGISLLAGRLRYLMDLIRKLSVCRPGVNGPG